MLGILLLVGVHNFLCVLLGFIVVVFEKPVAL